MTPKLARFTQKARAEPRMRFTALMGLLFEPAGLHASFERQSGKKAAGVDGISKKDYEVGLAERISGLSARLRCLSYRPAPVRRVTIPKGDGRYRPLGVPCFEDRLVQDRASRILQAIWEPEFRDCSYGFRPGRSAHDALRRVTEIIRKEQTQWVVEADIKGFFEHVRHEDLLRFLGQRIGDPIFKRVLRRFLKAGVMIDGVFSPSDTGTPQGGLVSPVLSNIYLHYVLDDWFEKQYAKRCHGRAHLVRYADDFIACFVYEDDARQYLSALTERLSNYGLEVEPSKTAVMRFGSRAKSDCRREGQHRPGTFNFLGFTHYDHRSRRGGFVVGRKTERKRFSGKLKGLSQRLSQLRLSGGAAMMEYVRQHLRGHIQYYGVSGNIRKVTSYVYFASRLLFKWLNRRSQRRSITWKRFALIIRQLLPRARVVHNLYSQPMWMPQTGSRMV